MDRRTSIKAMAVIVIDLFRGASGILVNAVGSLVPAYIDLDSMSWDEPTFDETDTNTQEPPF